MMDHSNLSMLTFHYGSYIDRDIDIYGPTEHLTESKNWNLKVVR